MVIKMMLAMNSAFKRVSHLTLLLFLVLLADSCTTGKAAFQQGNYVGAVMDAVERLRSSPDNKKARQILTLSYPEAIRVLEDEVRHASESASPDRWQIAVRNYTAINRLYETIQRSPAAKSVVPLPQERFNKLAEARGHAAEELYQVGLQSMLKGTREDSKQAYRSFNQALELVPEYKDAIEYATQAKADATLHVVVQPITRNLAGWNLESAVFGYRGNDFVRFLVPDQVQRENIQRIDQYIDLAVHGFSQSTPVFSRRTQELVDSVKTGEKKVNGKVVPVRSAVRAKATTIEKSITASGSATLRVTDATTGKVIGNWDISSSQRWSDQWAVFTGDARALPSTLRQLTERKESWPQESQLRNMVRQDLERKVKGQVSDFYRSY